MLSLKSEKHGATQALLVHQVTAPSSVTGQGDLGMQIRGTTWIQGAQPPRSARSPQSDSRWQVASRPHHLEPPLVGAELASQKGVERVVGLLLQAAVHQDVNDLSLLLILKPQPGRQKPRALNLQPARCRQPEADSAPRACPVRLSSEVSRVEKVGAGLDPRAQEQGPRADQPTGAASAAGRQCGPCRPTCCPHEGGSGHRKTHPFSAMWGLHSPAIAPLYFFLNLKQIKEN